MSHRLSICVFVLFATACSGGSSQPANGGQGGDDETDDTGNTNDEAGGSGGSDDGAGGNDNGLGEGGSGGAPADSGTPDEEDAREGAGGMAGNAAGGAGGTPSNTGGRTTLEPPAGVKIDWGACEPGGNCPSNCAERPTRATNKPKDFAAKDFRGPVFVPDRDGIIVIEAEDLAHTGNWRRTTTNPSTSDGSRFTGSGYLVWNGYTISGVEEDHNQIHQGNRCDWLVIKYWIRPEDAGPYTWEVRTHNVQPDGDNDAWHGRIGQTETVKRLVTGEGNQRKFTFERSPLLLYSAIALKPGLHAMYIQGRSAGFGIDRIVIRQGGSATRDLAKDLMRPASKPFPAGHFSP